MDVASEQLNFGSPEIARPAATATRPMSSAIRVILCFNVVASLALVRPTPR